MDYQQYSTWIIKVSDLNNALNNKSEFKLDININKFNNNDLLDIKKIEYNTDIIIILEVFHQDLINANIYNIKKYLRNIINESVNNNCNIQVNYYKTLLIPMVDYQ